MGAENWRANWERAALERVREAIVRCGFPIDEEIRGLMLLIRSKNESSLWVCGGREQIAMPAEFLEADLASCARDGLAREFTRRGSSPYPCIYWSEPQ